MKYMNCGLIRVPLSFLAQRVVVGFVERGKHTIGQAQRRTVVWSARSFGTLGVKLIRNIDGLATIGVYGLKVEWR